MKIDEAQFWDFLFKACGNFSHAAEAISRFIGEPYSAGACATRAKRQPKRLALCKNRMIDIAEHTLVVAMTQRDSDGMLLPSAVSAAKFIAGTKGRDRGYDANTKITIEGGDRPVMLAQALSELDQLDLSIETRKELLHAIEMKAALTVVDVDGEDNEEDEL